MVILPIYSIAAFDSQVQTFYVNDLAEHLKKHHFIHTPHKHDFYLCVYFTHGTGIHEIDFVNYPIEPGSVFFLTPGQFHNWTFDSKAEGFIFFHSKEFYDLNYQNRKIQDFPFFSSNYNSPLVQSVRENLHEVESLFQLLQKEAKKQHVYSSAELCSIVDLIYIFCTQEYSPTEKKLISSSGYYAKMIQFEQLVSTHYRTLKSPNEYAKLMYVSNKHLNRIVKETLNKTASMIIADRIVLEAKRLLVHSDYRIVEVADALGFSDYSYFNRYFKKHTNETPLGFAKKIMS